MNVNSIGSHVSTKELEPIQKNKNNLVKINDTPNKEVHTTDNVSLSKIKNSSKEVNQVELFQEHNSNPMDLVKSFSGKESIFPNEWKTSKVKAKADVANDSDLKSSIYKLQEAINKYPIDLLSKEKVKNIHLVGNLSCFGTTYTGTNSRENLYIGVTNNKEVEKTFHHELSSILLRNNASKFDNNKWNSLSKASNAYSSDAIKQGLNSVELNPALFEKGFLSDYSMSNKENDFNMFAENLFAGGKEFWEIADKNPKIYEKTKVVIQFYEKINPILNEDYFRALAN